MKRPQCLWQMTADRWRWACLSDYVNSKSNDAISVQLSSKVLTSSNLSRSKTIISLKKKIRNSMSWTDLALLI